MHFFIDYTKLQEQDDTDLRFGPDPNNINKFNLTTQFRLLNEAKAFACLDGMLIIQQNNSSTELVNLILKPLTQTKVQGCLVRYFIYRGVNKNSFFSNSGGVVSINTYNIATNTKLIQKYWERRFSEIKSNPTKPLPNPSPLQLGYGANNLPLSDPNNLNASRSIKDLFNGKAPAVSFMVTEGMWIGNFPASTIGFEIELETEIVLNTTLGFYRSSVSVVDLTGLTPGTFSHRAMKEKILTNIDPVAYFGMHSAKNTGVYVNQQSQSKSIPGTLYTDIISKFFNKNRVYVDIRSEKGMSYNFYLNYNNGSNNIQLRTDDAGEFNTITYGTNGWPIIYFNSNWPNFVNGSTTKNKVAFKLRTDNNSTPVLFIENPNNTIGSINSDNIENGSANYLKNIADSTNVGWTKTNTLYFPNAQNPNHDNAAYYIRLYYYFGNQVDFPNVLKNKVYFDSAFCSIDLDNLGDPNIKNSHTENPNPVYIKEAFNNEGTGGFSFVSRTGAFWDNNRILFYSRSHVKKTDFENYKNHEGSGKIYLNTYVRRLNIANSEYIKLLRDDFYYVCKEYYTNSQGTSSLKILGLNMYSTVRKNKQNVTERQPCEKEDLMLLGLSINEITALKNVPGLSNKHPRYIYLERDHFTTYLNDQSTQHYRYFKYSVKIQGLNNDGVPTIVIPDTPIKVYSRDNLFFSSIDFVKENINPTINLNSDDSTTNNDEVNNRIEFRIYRNGAIYLNDNLDICLLKKSLVPTNSLTDDLNDRPVPDDLKFSRPLYALQDEYILGEPSLVQKICYIYIDANPNDTFVLSNCTILCSLKIIMETGKKKVTCNTSESAADSIEDFNTLGYNLQTFDFTPFNDNDVYAKFSYKNANGDILTRGKTKDGIRNKKYESYKQIKYMVYVDRNQINRHLMINNRLEWVGTVRCFANPALFAVFLGALREVNLNVQCGGFAYPDGSSFPSNLHVNGEAFDTNYFQQIGFTNEDDVTFIRAIHKYGKPEFLIGPNLSSLIQSLNNLSLAEKPTFILDGDHNTHLHTQKLKIHG